MSLIPFAMVSATNTSATSTPLTTARSRMACQNCRLSKHRCKAEPPPELLDGDELAGPIIKYGADRCPGCKVACLPQCIWLPKLKQGRPRKRKATEEEQRAAMASVAFDPMSFLLPDASGLSPAFEILSAASPASPLAPTLTDRSNLLAMQLSSYLSHASHFCGVFDRALVDSQAPATFMAAAQVASALGLQAQGPGMDGGAAADAINAANLAIDGLMASPAPLSDLNSMLYGLEALVLSVFLNYGMGNPPSAKRAISTARDWSLAIGLEVFDRPYQHGAFDFSSPDSSSSSSADSSSHTGSARISSDQVSLETAEAFRRVWWELCTVDAMMHIALGEDVSSALLRTFASKDVRMTPEDELRVRAASVLLESANPNSPPTQSRYDSMQTIISNSSAQAHHQWSLSQSPRERERNLMVFVMLQAARIQLCRQTSFAYASFGMASCSFNTKDSAFSLSPQESVVALQTHGSHSIEPTQSMIQASDSIMEILRLDSERTSLHERKTPLARHSPFLGCSQVAAAFGYAAAAASLAGQQQSQTDQAAPSPSSSATLPPSSLYAQGAPSSSTELQQPSASAAATAASAATQTRKESDAEHHRIWKRRAILSNLAAAQSNLVAIAPTWPVAMRMAQEVMTCSNLFEQSVLLY